MPHLALVSALALLGCGSFSDFVVLMTLTISRRTGQMFCRMSFGEKLTQDTFSDGLRLKYEAAGKKVSPFPHSGQKDVDVGGGLTDEGHESGMKLGWGRLKVWEGNFRTG